VQSATRLQSPDYADYHALKARGLTHTRASLTIARKIARRSYHLPHNLGPAAIAPIPDKSFRLPPPFPKMIKLAVSSHSFRGTHHEVATPTKTERLQSTPSGRPINHHVVTTTASAHRPR
jgi:hypothetical protein